MADITPVTREEYYLAKAGGQDVPVPSAVTREEYYLEKLSNDSVVVPSPVTRREKFLYFACGGEIDLPSEEKMTRLERLIAKAGGMEISTPTAVTRLEKFWANVEGGGWKTIAGVLPLTFTAKGGTAGDWVIEGNDDNGTENLFDSIEQGSWSAGNFIKENSNTRCRSSNALDITEGQKYTIHCETTGSVTGKVLFQFKTNTGSSVGESGWLDFGTNGNNTVTAPAAATKATLIFGLLNNVNCTPSDFANIMLVKGSTAPDHYIPYQQGVGERTVNLFDISKVTDRVVSGHTFLQVVNDEIIVNLTLSTSTPDGDNHTLRDFVGNLELNQAYTFKATSTGANKFIYLSGTGANFVWGFNESKTFTTQESLDAALDARILWYASGANTAATISNIMLVKGSTAPSTYVPYGYQIPLTISQQGQPDKTVDIYIGDSPLTEGETVSKTSTGVDIDLFNGENTVSTTLYNKPTMEIRYK